MKCSRSSCGSPPSRLPMMGLGDFIGASAARMWSARCAPRPRSMGRLLRCLARDERLAPSALKPDAGRKSLAFQQRGHVLSPFAIGAPGRGPWRLLGLRLACHGPIIPRLARARNQMKVEWGRFRLSFVAPTIPTATMLAAGMTSTWSALAARFVGRILKPGRARPINLGFFRLLVPRGRGVAHESHGAPAHHGIAAATPRPGLCAGQGATGWSETAVVVALRNVSEKAPAGLQPDLSMPVDKSAGHFDANTPTVEIEQRSGEPHGIAIDGEANRHTQDIAGRGHLFANIGAAKACFEGHCRSLRAHNREKRCRGQNTISWHASLLSRRGRLQRPNVRATGLPR